MLTETKTELPESQRRYSFFDRFCLGIDQVVRALTDSAKTTGKTYPPEQVGYQKEQQTLTADELKHAAALMRINHAGEICAQALYHGQGFVTSSPDVQAAMQHAAVEEGDHLVWCKLRLDELGSHTSYLNPLWYSGSFCIGMIAGMVGDEWSLGFVAETERQVIKHLAEHLTLLSNKDLRSAAILKQMEQDEAKHRDDAISAGAKELPSTVKVAMSLVAKIMVKTSYWV